MLPCMEPFEQRLSEISGHLAKEAERILAASVGMFYGEICRVSFTDDHVILTEVISPADFYRAPE
jgi:hypothetical protein